MITLILALILSIYIIKILRDKFNSYEKNRLQCIHKRVLANEDKVADIVIEISDMDEIAEFFYECVRNKKDRNEIRKFRESCDKYIEKFLKVGFSWASLADYVYKGISLCTEENKVCSKISIKKIFNRTYRRCVKYTKRMVILQEKLNNLKSKHAHYLLIEDKRCS